MKCILCRIIMIRRSLKKLNLDVILLSFSGLIGRSWSMLFAAAGYKVVMFDIQPTQVQSALSEILVQLKNLQEKGLLRGSLTVEEQHARISGTNDLRQCVQDAVYIQVTFKHNFQIYSLCTSFGWCIYYKLPVLCHKDLF